MEDGGSSWQADGRGKKLPGGVRNKSIRAWRCSAAARKLVSVPITSYELDGLMTALDASTQAFRCTALVAPENGSLETADVSADASRAAPVPSLFLQHFSCPLPCLVACMTLVHDATLDPF